MIKQVSASAVPTNRATEIANTAVSAIEHEENARAIVYVVDELPGGRGGIALCGYGSDPSDVDKAISDVLQHLRAMVELSGREMAVSFAPAPRPRGSG